MTLSLTAKYSFYHRLLSGLPLVILMDGWDGEVEAAYTNILSIANLYDIALCSTSRRGYAASNGNRDASGREIQDIVDVIAQMRINYPLHFQDKVAIIGVSGGAGNALAAACKFPDTFNVVASLYGMSDYGRDATNGWYQTTAAYRATIASSVGDTPTNVPDKYYARDAVAAITNFSGGKLYLYHDNADTTAPVVNSQRINTAMAGIGNCEYHESKEGDAVRYPHSGEINDAGFLDAMATVLPAVINTPPWTIPAAGTITIIGYIVTKRFSIWLNTGLDASATVVYDTVAGTYTVTPLTSNAVVSVAITQGALTASGNTDGATLFTVA